MTIHLFLLSILWKPQYSVLNQQTQTSTSLQSRACDLSPARDQQYQPSDHFSSFLSLSVSRLILHIRIHMHTDMDLADTDLQDFANREAANRNTYTERNRELVSSGQHHRHHQQNVPFNSMCVYILRARVIMWMTGWLVDWLFERRLLVLFAYWLVVAGAYVAHRG